jgi:2-polyprenyl-6-methoxyphenol hydroxylase-like FAD-dependent oxidoreductase
MDPAAPAPTYGGLINLGGYTRGVQVDAEPGSYTMIFGKRAFFGYALAPGDEVWWFANVPRGDDPTWGEVEAITADAWQEQLAALYADDAGPAVQLVRASDTVDIMRASPIHAIPHLPVWHTGRRTVIGDAAHAPTPTSGQGASLAVEDAVVLAKCLRDLSDPQQALARFEALRRPRVERIIKQAARINSNKAAGPVARTLRDAGPAHRLEDGHQQQAARRTLCLPHRLGHADRPGQLLGAEATDPKRAGHPLRWHPGALGEGGGITRPLSASCVIEMTAGTQGPVPVSSP